MLSYHIYTVFSSIHTQMKEFILCLLLIYAGSVTFTVKLWLIRLCNGDVFFYKKKSCLTWGSKEMCRNCLRDDYYPEKKKQKEDSKCTLFKEQFSFVARVKFVFTCN